MTVGRFLISRDATGAFRWVLRDADGATVTEGSDGYSDNKACTAAVERIRKLVAKAEVIDLTMPAKVIKPARPAKKAKAAKKKGKR